MSRKISISEFRGLSLQSVSGLFLSNQAGELLVKTLNNHDESDLAISNLNDKGLILEAIHFQDEVCIIRIKGRNPNLCDLGIFNVMTDMLQQQKLTSSYHPSYTSEHISRFMYAGGDSVFSNLDVSSLSIFENEIYFVQAKNRWHLRKISFLDLMTNPNCLATAKTIELFGKPVHHIGRINKSGIMPLTLGNQLVEFDLYSNKITYLTPPEGSVNGYVLGNFRLSETIDKLKRVIVGRDMIHLMPLNTDAALKPVAA